MPKIYDTGKIWADTFKNECLEDETRFEKRIKRRKVLNFMTDAAKLKMKSKNRKEVLEIKGTRDLFGRLLYLAVTSNVDLQVVFNFPLTPVPLSLGNIDGLMNKTPKSSLKKKLEEKIESEEPPEISELVIDLMFLIRGLTNLPITFKGIAERILSLACRTTANRIHLVADRYDCISIKCLEQEKRGCDTTSKFTYRITGPDQSRPRDFSKALSSVSFKMELLQFLVTEWEDPAYMDILKDKVMIYGFKNYAYSYKVVGNVIEKEHISELESNHIEADTRIMQHINFIHTSRQIADQLNIVVRADDTDILVILIYHVSKNKHIKVYMEVGHSSNNTRHFIDVSSLSNRLGSDICAALPAYHALIGCDYSPAFKGKGKVRPLSLLEKNPTFLKAIGSLGIRENVDRYDIATIEHYVCLLYGQKVISVNHARYLMFLEKYKPKDDTVPLQKIKGIDESLLPPCQASLYQHVYRSNHIAMLWKNAHQNLPTTKPEKHGWLLENNKFTLCWYTGDVVPACLESSVEEEVIHQQNTEENDSDSYSDSDEHSEEDDDDNDDDY